MGILKNLSNEANTLLSHSDDFWSKIWKLPVLPKLKHVLWCVSQECVGVYGRLMELNIKEIGLCPRCHYRMNKVLHALFFYPYSGCWWSNQGWDNILLDAPTTSFCHRLAWFMDKFSGNELLKFSGAHVGFVDSA